MADKSYNVQALQGLPVDDMEVVEFNSLPREVAYTPKINDAMLDMVHKENFEFYMEEGMDEKEAKAKADMNKMNAMKDIKVLMAKKGML